MTRPLLFLLAASLLMGCSDILDGGIVHSVSSRRDGSCICYAEGGGNVTNKYTLYTKCPCSTIPGDTLFFTFKRNPCDTLR